MTWPWDQVGSPLAGAGPGRAAAGRPAANPPGRSQLAYRVGTYGTTVSEILDRLVMSLAADSEDGDGDGGGGVLPGDLSPGRMATADESEERRYVRFNLAAEGNWLVALAHSWAAVIDVLTFYQERLLQEGYLETAVEPRSVYELVHMVGYQPIPGVAGHTDLAIQVTDVKGLPPEIELPHRLVVRSVPPPGAEPQTFETVAPLSARESWNLLAPEPRGRKEPPKVVAGETHLLLAGTATGLAAGMPLLVVGEVAGEELRSARRLTAVAPVTDPDDGSVGTRVAWEDPLALDLVRRRPGEPDAGGTAKLKALAHAVVAEAEVFTLPRQSGLFGRGAPPWASLPAQVKRQEQGLAGGVVVLAGGEWRSRNVGLPVEATVVSLAAGRGHLYAGTNAHGVFHSVNGGETWVPSRRGPAQLDAPALTVDHRGVVWSGGSGGGVYRSTDHGESWEDASGRQVAPPPRPSSWRARWRSLRSRLRPSGAEAPGGPLPGAAIHDLEAVLLGSAGDARAAILAATGAGVYRTIDGGRSWRPVNRGLPGTTAPAGTSDLAVRSLTRGTARGTVWAASLRGVYFSDDGGERWRPRNRGLPGADPFTGYSATRADDVAVIGGRRGGERLLAATEAGLYLSEDGGEHWRPQLLAPVEGAGAEGGEVAGAEFPVPGLRTPVTALQKVEDPVTLDRRVYAATADDLWESRDDGGSWRRVTSIPPGPVLALAAGDGRPSVLAAVPFAGFADEWPGFYLRDGQIDLDAVVEGVVPGSWVVLVPGGADDPTAAGIYRVQRVTRLRRRDFGLDAMITRLQVEPDPRLAGFDLRDTQVFLGSLALELQPVMVMDYDLALNVLGVSLRSMPPTRRVIVTGELPAETLPLTLLENTDLDDLKEAFRRLEALPPDLEVEVRIWSSFGEPVDRHSEPGNVLELTVQDLLDFLGNLVDARGAVARAVDREKEERSTAAEAAEAPGTARGAGPKGAAGPTGEPLPETMPRVLAETLDRMMRRVVRGRKTGPLVRLMPAGAGDAPPRLELKIVAPPRRVGRSTTVSTLSASLEDCREDPAMGSKRAVMLPAVPGEAPPVVDAASLLIYGNVVPAVEGTTVAGEVLGDGDATVPNQVFRLAQPPTFRLGGDRSVGGGRRGAGAGGDRGADAAALVASLEVRVQGQRWHRVDHLEGRGPDERVYRLDVDQDGVGSVVFGSGEEGSRLPTGKDNVRATYATGMTTGSVPAGGVSLPQNRPIGLGSVSNPLPTTPGADAEDPDRAREMAPRSVLTLGRVVSLGDYADFALAFPGIARSGSWRVPATDPATGPAVPGRTGRGAVQVTVAVPGGGPAPAGVLADLRAAIGARRPEALPLYVGSYRPVRVRVRARLTIDPDFERKAVEAEVTQHLLSRFGFDRAGFGDVISAAEVVREIQREPGVESVDLDELSAYDGRQHRQMDTGAAPEARSCRARAPSWADGELLAAELLILTDVVLEPPTLPGGRQR